MREFPSGIRSSFSSTKGRRNAAPLSKEGYPMWKSGFFTLTFIMASLAASGATQLETAPTGWRVEAEEGRVTSSKLSITNRCLEPHYFRIENDVKYLGFGATEPMLIDAAVTAEIGVSIDATGLKAGVYRDRVVVDCLDCKKVPECAQESYEVTLEIAITKPTLRKGESRPPVSTSFASTRATQSGANDVGIIPQSSSGCPVGSEHIYISMDDEDKSNASSVSGWTGNISHYSTGTTFGFCRVDGTLFKSHPGRDYVVLQLGSSCPQGSVSFFRVFDNEHKGNNNWSTGNVSPSQSGPPTKLHFCFFPAGVSPTMTSFPNFYVPYGVFATPSSLWLSTGKAYTDDEDDNNHDYTYSTTINTYWNRFAQIIYGVPNPLTTKNSYLLVAKVRNDTCNINPCPYIGSYDGANCWVGKPPAGTNAFIYSTNFYYTPVNGNQCPKPGSWFDGVNCFMAAIPPQTHPFIWSNMWYVEPICCP
jgi:hypothetical protein